MLGALPPSTPSSCPQLSAWASPAGDTAAASPFKHQLSRPLLHLADHSSDKSSQDRLSFLDQCPGLEEQEGAAASAGASSRLNLVPAAKGDSTPDCSLENALGTSSSIQTTTRSSARAASDLAKEDVSVDSTLLGASAVTGPHWQLDCPDSRSACNHPAKLGSLQIQGCTLMERAASARKLCADALQTACTKAKRATRMIAIAQHLATEASRASKRRKVSHVHLCQSSTSVLVGARISVYWADDDAFYKGRIVDVNEDEDIQKIVYDDEVVEWLSLCDERFKLLTPRAASAGCTTPFLREVEALGVEGLVDSKRCALPHNAAGFSQPAADEAVGWRIVVHSRADGKQHQCQVLAYDANRRQHHVLYQDGEDEWLSLADECVESRSAGRCLPILAGLPMGEEVPAGHAAIGWRIAVYWTTDMSFYSGTIQDYDSSTGRHQVSYSDGDEEFLLLAKERIKWVLPPNLGVMHPATPAKQPPPPLDKHTAARTKSEPGKLDHVWWAVNGYRSDAPARQATRWGGRAARWSRGTWSQDVPRKPGSTESISQMLERVDADELALMGHSDAVKPTEQFYVASCQEVFDGSSPQAGGLEGHDSHNIGVSPQGSASLSPVQSGHLLPLEPFLGQKQALRSCSSITKPFLFCTAPADSDLSEGMNGMLQASAARLRLGAKSEPELQRWETLGTNACDFGTPLDRSSSALLDGDVMRNSGIALSASPVPVLNRFLSVPSLVPFGRDDACTELCTDPTPEGLDLLDMLMVNIPSAELQSEW